MTTNVNRIFEFLAFLFQTVLAFAVKENSVGVNASRKRGGEQIRCIMNQLERHINDRSAGPAYKMVMWISIVVKVLLAVPDIKTLDLANICQKI